MISLRFVDLGWPVVSPAISWWSGHWSNHVDLLSGDGRMITAAPGGVTEREESGLSARRVEIVSLDCTPWQRDAALAFAREQIGKPYDYLGVFWFPFRPHWNDKGRWFCSELTAAALHHAGIISVPRRVYRVSPGDLYRMTQG